ncbi:MAG: NINE protein [Gammaproteobacteria bacterium]|nr:NINE protein [Gammaproteobacteria bacterium]
MIRERSTAIAYLLWLPLGIIGAHKFYLRKPGMGILYLFTGGLFIIGWIIDLFTLPDQVEDCNEIIYVESGYLEEEDLNADIAMMEDRIDELEEEVAWLRSELRRKDSASGNSASR